MVRKKGSYSDSTYYEVGSYQKKVNGGENAENMATSTRKSSRLIARSSTPKYMDDISDTWFESNGESSSNPTAMDSANAQSDSKHATSSAAYSSIALSVTRDKLQSEAIPERFDDYLNSLDDLLSPPPQEVRFSPLEARKKLSEILRMDLRSILSSEDIVSDILMLSSTIQRDPNLQVAEDEVLKFIQGIPAGAKYFEKTKKMISDSEKFFADMEAKITLANNLKNEYNESKGKAALLQKQFISESLAIEKNDPELFYLLYKRDQVSNDIEKKKQEIDEFTSKQKMVVSCLPNVVREVKLAHVQRSEWEMKKKIAEDHEAAILEKFAPLKGFSFA